MLRHPGFAEARERLIRGAIELGAGRSRSARIQFEVGRALTAHAILGLHAEQDLGHRPSWATLGRLHEDLAGLGAISRNRIDAFVAYLERYGFVERVRHPGDRRVSLIAPTEALQGLDAEHLTVLRRAAAVVAEPGRMRVGEVGARHDAYVRERRARLRAILARQRRHATVMSFFERDSGYLVLMLLMAGCEGRARHETELPFEAAAKLAGVSRTHVRLLIERAEAAGLVTVIRPGGRRIRLERRLVEAVDEWVAEMLELHLEIEATIHGEDGGFAG